MEDTNFKKIQYFSRKRVFKLDGKPRLSGYSFFYDDEEYIYAKKINSIESREEGSYYFLKVIRGVDDQIGLTVIKDNILIYDLWTKIIDAFSLEKVFEKAIKE